MYGGEEGSVCPSVCGWHYYWFLHGGLDLALVCLYTLACLPHYTICRLCWGVSVSEDFIFWIFLWGGFLLYARILFHSMNCVSNDQVNFVPQMCVWVDDVCLAWYIPICTIVLNNARQFPPKKYDIVGALLVAYVLYVCAISRPGALISRVLSSFSHALTLTLCLLASVRSACARHTHVGVQSRVACLHIHLCVCPLLLLRHALSPSHSLLPVSLFQHFDSQTLSLPLPFVRRLYTCLH